MLLAACGDDSGNPSVSEVTFNDLQGGFWLGVDDQGQVDHWLQFTTAKRARELYGGLASPASGSVTFGTPTADELFSYFGEHDPLALVFYSRNPKIDEVYAIKVSEGKIQASRLGEGASSVEHGVLFQFGFHEPFSAQMTRFERNREARARQGPLELSAVGWRDHLHVASGLPVASSNGLGWGGGTATGDDEDAVGAIGADGIWRFLLVPRA